jgi:hypothetical protein
VSEEGQAVLFNAETGERVGAPRELGAPGRWVDFHPERRFFVTTAGSKVVARWHAPRTSTDRTPARTTACFMTALSRFPARAERRIANNRTKVAAALPGTIRTYGTYVVSVLASVRFRS